MQSVIIFSVPSNIDDHPVIDYKKLKELCLIDGLQDRYVSL